MDVAGAAGRAGRGRLPRGRPGSARLRRQRQAAPWLRPRHRRLGRSGPDPCARRGQRSGHRARLGRAGGLDDGRLLPQGGAQAGRHLDGAPAADAVLDVTDPLGQGRRSGYAFGFQVPVLPEHSLVRDHAERVGQMLRSWSGPGWPDPETERRYRTAMCIPSVAHSALEYHRWFVRSRVRPDGVRYAQRMRAPIQAPTLHLQGALDTCVLPATARGSGRQSTARTAGACSTGLAISRTRSSPTASTANSAAGWRTPNRSDERGPGPGASPGTRGRVRPGTRGRVRPGTVTRPGGRGTRGPGTHWGARCRAARPVRIACPMTWPFRRRRRWSWRSTCWRRAARFMRTRCSRRRGSRPRTRSGSCGAGWPRSRWG